MEANIKLFLSLPALRNGCLSLIWVLTLYGSLFIVNTTHAQNNSWVSYDSNGKLVYGSTASGDQMIDYSYAGYAGGAAVLPVVPMASGGHVLTPSGGDDTTQIQNEINRVQVLPLTNGLRGAIMLGAGTFKLSQTLTINASGIVLRGAGPSTILQMMLATKTITTTACDGTQSNVTVTANFPAVTLSGIGGLTFTGTEASISNTYSQAGLTTFNVYPHSLFTVGEKVVVRRPVTQSWKNFVGMDVLDNVPAGCSTTSWLTTSQESDFERVVTGQSTYTVTLDEGIPDSIDRNYLVGYIQPYTNTGWITNVGVEDLTIQAPAGYQPVETSSTNQPFQAIWMNSLEDGWVRNIKAVNTFNSFWMNQHVRQVTFTGVAVQQDIWQPGNTPQFTHFTLQGDVSRVLVQNATIAGSGSYNTFFLETQALSAGPNVVLNSDFTGTGDVGGHQRWATGLLADNVSLHDVHIPATSGDNNNDTSNHYVSFSARNAGVEGYAHGWTSAWNVVWNSTAQRDASSPGREFLIEAPAGATNWCVGCIGAPLSTVQPDGNASITFPTPPVGTADSYGTQVLPQSLYVAQLLERIGTFRIVNQNSGLAMTASNGLVTQETYTGATSQQWRVIPVAGTPGAYNLSNVASGQLITFATGAYGTQASTIACGASGQQACSTAQNFTVTPGFQLLGLKYSEPLVISGDSLAAGTAVVQEKQDRNLSQVWQLVSP